MARLQSLHPFLKVPDGAGMKTRGWRVGWGVKALYCDYKALRWRDEGLEAGP